MFEFTIRVPCKNPRLVVESLLPDLKRDKYSKIKLIPGKNFVEIRVESEKIGHMKAIVNTYISLVSTLEKIDEKI
jgi:tRNA threonylcarbamoyladenosine modification (KEOPS) complex  Pcc1 subunit